MNNEYPMISVIMSVYNESKNELERAVLSILEQTYKNFEFIIVLDNPKCHFLKEFINKMATIDNRIVIIENDTNIGLAQSMNKCIKIAKGKYIARMDADDISYPNRLEKELNFIEKNDFDLVYCNKENIDENSILVDGGTLGKQNPNKTLPFANCVIHPTVLVKTDVIKKVGGYRNFPTSQDYDLWLRLLTFDYKIGFLDEILFSYRIRENSISSKKKLIQYYTSVYQQELYRMRLNNKIDNYSEENYNLYINKYNITEAKNQRFVKSLKYFDKAVYLLKNRNLLFVLYLFISFMHYPSIILNKLFNLAKIMYIKNSR